MTFQCKHPSVPSNAIKVSYSAAQRVINRTGSPARYLGFFFLEIGKKEDILDWEWGLISGPGDREKRP